MTFRACPFDAVYPLLLSPPDSELRMFLDEVHQLIERCPTLLARVEADLDRHGKKKKALRLDDAAWSRSRTAPLPSFEEERQSATDPASLSLSRGRPRTPAYVVLMSLCLRGFFGAGFKACDTTTMMQESITLHIFFANLGMKMPGRSTLTELVNAVTNETRQHLLDAQIAAVLELGWDDFSVMLQDSTHVEGNTAWPTDSQTLTSLVGRILRVGSRLPRLQLPALDCPSTVKKHFGVMITLNRAIALAPRSKERARIRRQRYKQLLWRARRMRRLLDDAITQVETALVLLDVAPSRKAMATQVVARLRADIKAFEQAIANCESRVIHEAKVPVGDKILSLSDPDAGFIAKGQRVPVIGYKPQVSRSGTGFVTGLLLPKGNAADSGQLVPMFDEVVRRTTVTPGTVSVDDGYASQANVDALRAKNVEVISINGAKGRALTAEADWNSEEFEDARNIRSAVESLMFTLKQGFDFGEVARRGLPAVHAELLEKALAYNFCRMATTRRAVARKHDGDASLKLAA
jgi:Transposase DDE domain